MGSCDPSVNPSRTTIILIIWVLVIIFSVRIRQPPGKINLHHVNNSLPRRLLLQLKIVVIGVWGKKIFFFMKNSISLCSNHSKGMYTRKMNKYNSSGILQSFYFLVVERIFTFLQQHERRRKHDWFYVYIGAREEESERAMKYNLQDGKFISLFGLPYVIKSKLMERKAIYYLQNFRLLSISKRFVRPFIVKKK